MKIFLILLMANFFVSCAPLTTQRSYLAEMEQEDTNLFEPHKDFRVTGGDNGKVYRNQSEVATRVPGNVNSAFEHGEQSLRKELRGLESKLPEDEFQQYAKMKGMFSNDSERIYYLKLPSGSDRQGYLEAKGLIPSHSFTGMDEEMAVRQKDVVLGMTKNSVMRSWGRPHRVDVAGNPRLENERWAYYLHDGKTRYVYFERGKVEGWAED